MRLTLATPDLSSGHIMAIISDKTNAIGFGNIGKTRPASARIKLGSGRKKHGIAADTVIIAVLMVVVVFAAKRRLGASILGNAILFGR